jgi:E3 ubiquitin-protein ligase UBR7
MTDHTLDQKRVALPVNGIVTAVDYLESQEALKNEALETLPYDPTECSATTLGDGVATTRQNLYACLTCREGVCYSCSIQCHPGANHELVELFGKRGYACGCPTTRCVLKKKHRRASASSTGSNSNNSNISSSSSNSSSSSTTTGPTQSAISAAAPAAAESEESKPMTGHNFRGLFCVCDEPYNPDVEDRLMVQCCFGTACDEDWFHDSCVLDWITGKPVGPDATTDATTDDPTTRAMEGGNKQEIKKTLSTTILVKNETHEIKKEEDTVITDDSTEGKHNIQEPMTAAPLLPITKDELGDAAGFVCWNCVRSEQALFDLIFSAIDSNPITTDNNKNNKSNNDNVFQGSKPIGRRIFRAGAPKSDYLVLFDDPCYKAQLHTLATTSSTALLSALAPYLSRFPFLFTEETTYTPPLDTSADASEDEAALLNTIPRQQAIEGLKALDGIRASLTTFLRGFAENDRVVTEEDVTNFFENERKRKKAKH